MDRQLFAERLAEIGLNPGAEQLDRLERFEDALYEANRRMNLTRVPREECWVRHFLDSVLWHALIPAGAKVLDIGSGPGFPSWPLACLRPDLSVDALDSSGKMLGFLRSQPLPNLRVVEARAENWGVRDAYDLVTGRAVAPLPIQLELSAAPCRRGGRVVPMRSIGDLAEAEAFDPSFLGLRRVDLVTMELPLAGALRLFPVYEKVQNTPARYPRRWAEIKKAHKKT